MDAKLKAKWVKALRSGAYRQCRDAMRDGGGYCCLAVLRDGCGSEDPFLDVKDAAAILIDKNDGKNGEREHSFPEIADWIEKNL